jgi:hypothetical protein
VIRSDAMGLAGLQMMVALPVAILLVAPVWLIIRRIGFSPWLSLLVLVPLVNLVMLYYIAFAEWPEASS